MLRSLIGKLRQTRKAAQPPINTVGFEKHTKHRNLMPLYDLWPYHHNRTFVAPNATIVGEVSVGESSAIMYGAVIRGDINPVSIYDTAYVGENTVIHSAASLPNGSPAETIIGCHTYVGANCVLYSCLLDDFSVVGSNSVILEGSRLERGSMIAPNSVVPPGRLIPSKQLWGGNPVKYIRDLTDFDELANRSLLNDELEAAGQHIAEFEDFGHAHMYDS